MIELSIIIPIRGRTDLTKRCIESIACDSSYEIITVETPSRDMLQDSFPHHRNILLDWNRLDFCPPIARAWNQGILESKGKYVFVLNNDTVLGYRTCDRVLRALAETPLKIVTPFPVEAEEELAIAKTMSDIPDPWVFTFLGFGFAMSREVWEEAGRFDEGFTFTCEDDDFRFRAHVVSGQLKNTRIYHQRSVTSNSVRDVFLSFERERSFHRFLSRYWREPEQMFGLDAENEKIWIALLKSAPPAWLSIMPILAVLGRDYGHAVVDLIGNRWTQNAFTKHSHKLYTSGNYNEMLSNCAVAPLSDCPEGVQVLCVSSDQVPVLPEWSPKVSDFIVIVGEDDFPWEFLEANKDWYPSVRWAGCCVISKWAVQQ